MTADKQTILREAMETFLQTITALVADESEEKAPPLPEIYTEEEAAAYLTCTRSHLYHIRQQGLITYQKSGSRILYTRKDIDDYLERITVKAWSTAK